jgi:hypothetical protein
MSSHSAVIITNSINSIFWSKNLDKLGIQDDDLSGEKVYRFFKSRINKLYPTEGIVEIQEQHYQYNVKAISEKNSHDFVILEIMTEPIEHSFINDSHISDLIRDNQLALEKGTGEILSLLEKSPNKLSKEEYTSVEDSVKRVLASNANLSLASEMRNELYSKRNPSCSLSSTITNLAEVCQAVFKDTDVEIDLVCVEDIYGHISETAFEDICSAMLNRALCSARGRVDKIVFSLEMLVTGTVEVAVTIQNPSGEVRAIDLDMYTKKLGNGRAVGTDLFNIRYFCREVDGGSTERIDHVKHEVKVSVRIPNCESQGVMLFSCKNKSNAKSLPLEVYDRYGNVTKSCRLATALSDMLGNIKHYLK